MLNPPRWTCGGSGPVTATLAPFIEREKPQVSPRLAASFIKNCNGIRRLRAAQCRPSDWTEQSRRQPRDTVVPVLIGFLRQYAAASRSSADAQVDGHPAFKRLNDDAHIHSTADSAVPICNDRHNFATDRSNLRRKRKRHGAPQTRPMQNGPGGATGYRLPKSWSNAGAFSLLSPKSKLAQD